MTKAEILDALRNAKGPDRVLDAWIACEFIYPDLRPARKDDHLEHQRGYPPSDGDIWCPTGFLIAPSYTRSIDDAVYLVERVRPGEECVIRTGPKCCAGLIGSNADAKSGATPAIALLIALLSVEVE